MGRGHIVAASAQLVAGVLIVNFLLHEQPTFEEKTYFEIT